MAYLHQRLLTTTYVEWISIAFFTVVHIVCIYLNKTTNSHDKNLQWLREKAVVSIACMIEYVPLAVQVQHRKSARLRGEMQTDFQYLFIQVLFFCPAFAFEVFLVAKPSSWISLALPQLLALLASRRRPSHTCASQQQLGLQPSHAAMHELRILSCFTPDLRSYLATFLA